MMTHRPSELSRRSRARRPAHGLRRLILGSLLLAGLLLPRAGRATAPGQRAEAHQLTLQGRALFERGDFAQAEPLFARAHSLDPIAGNLWRWARCLEEVGRVVEARARFAQLVEEHPGSRYLPGARDKVAALAAPEPPPDPGPRVDPPEQGPSVDPPEPGPPVDPPEPAPGVASPDSGGTLDPAEGPGPSTSRRRWPWLQGLLVVAGVSAATGITGLVIAQRAEADASRATDPGRLEQHNAWVRAGNGMQIAGLGVAATAGVAAGALWLLQGPATEGTPSASVRCVPGGVAVVGRF